MPVCRRAASSRSTRRSAQRSRTSGQHRLRCAHPAPGRPPNGQGSRTSGHHRLRCALAPHPVGISRPWQSIRQSSDDREHPPGPLHWLHWRFLAPHAAGTRSPRDRNDHDGMKKPRRSGAFSCYLVELGGFEPPTSSLRTKRATNCAIAPSAPTMLAPALGAMHIRGA